MEISVEKREEFLPAWYVQYLPAYKNLYLRTC